MEAHVYKTFDLLKPLQLHRMFFLHEGIVTKQFVTFSVTISMNLLPVIPLYMYFMSQLTSLIQVKFKCILISNCLRGVVPLCSWHVCHTFRKLLM